MQLLRVRTGHATNSSSTHSLIFIEGDLPQTTEYKEFGWDHWTAADLESKENYFALILFHNLSYHLGEETAKLVLNEVMGRPMPPEFTTTGWSSDRGYIDHQSMVNLPMSWDGKSLDLEFAREFKDWLLQPGLCILGGNDNDDTKHPLIGPAKDFKLPLSRAACPVLVARKDQGIWTLYNRFTGGKIRFRWPTKDEIPTREHEWQPAVAGKTEIPRAIAPELIDIKITDKCMGGCRYCYQDSHPDGEHAKDLHMLISACEQLKVFEVAIGGGEPLLHPNFVSILRRFRNAGVVPNFSTRDIAWLKDTQKAKQILDCCGGYAFSVDNSEQILDVMKEVVYRGYRCPSFHVVVGAIEDWVLNRIIDVCIDKGYHLVLLGYKVCGRAKPSTRPRSTWYDHIKKKRAKSRYFAISADTSLIKEYSAELEEAGVHPLFLEPYEGAYNCYIDAVNHLIGPSSYCDPKELQCCQFDYQHLPGRIKKAMASWVPK